MKAEAKRRQRINGKKNETTLSKEKKAFGVNSKLK